MEEEANLFNQAYLLKLPWLPSCITLNPIAAIKHPKKAHSKIANNVGGVKNTK